MLTANSGSRRAEISQPIFVFYFLVHLSKLNLLFGSLSLIDSCSTFIFHSFTVASRLDIFREVLIEPVICLTLELLFRRSSYECHNLFCKSQSKFGDSDPIVQMRIIPKLSHHIHDCEDVTHIYLQFP